MLRLHDTATGKLAELIPRDPGRIGIYVCGPTVYGAPHTGHGRFSLVYDVLRRYLEYRGLVVDYVSNITDIDDKIIARANAEGRSWQEVATECEQQWWDAIDALGVKRPTIAPRATDYITEMIELIEELVRNGLAYETRDGVYLSVERVEGYGLFAHQSLEALLDGSNARVEMVEDKRSPADFALWKRAKPAEPTWPSPFGDGRPGWHTECVAMSLKLLGEGFDLHGGGTDLVFPHHENERAQAVALGRPFARHWVHNGLVEVSGEKMSKSLGNFMTLAELMEQTDARSYRLLVLRSHYRSAIEVSPETLADATAALERIDACARRFIDQAPRNRPLERGPEAEELVGRFIAFMDEDLDTPRAIASLFEAIRRANSLLDDGHADAAQGLASQTLDLFAALGLRAAGAVEEIDDVAAAYVAQRDVARAGRDFRRADQLRDRLEELGWRVEDTAQGTRIYRDSPTS